MTSAASMPATPLPTASQMRERDSSARQLRTAVAVGCVQGSEAVEGETVESAGGVEPATHRSIDSSFPVADWMMPFAMGQKIG